MSAPTALKDALGRLRRWLIEDALPLWASAGRDPAGGFYDRLGQDGRPAVTPKRARVQARQAYVYATAAQRGWMDRAAASDLARHGLDALLALRRPDGLYTASPPQEILDGMGLLYDQAFALFAFAAGHSLFGDYEVEADSLRRALGPYAHPLGGFTEAPGLAQPLFANPNMHLIESAMAWRAAAPDPAWPEMADALAALARNRLTREGGLVLEAYDADWRAAPDKANRVVWPGHLYEWAFLLLRHDPGDARHRAAAEWLIQVAEAKGVVNGTAIFALDGHLAPVDPGARLWAQTERLRAATHVAALLDERWWSAAVDAAASLERFLATPVPGLWRDWQGPAGEFREEPAPASSFYHIVGAIAELEDAIG